MKKTWDKPTVTTLETSDILSGSVCKLYYESYSTLAPGTYCLYGPSGNVYANITDVITYHGSCTFAVLAVGMPCS